MKYEDVIVYKGGLQQFLHTVIETVYYLTVRLLLIFIFGRGSAISSAEEGKSGFLNNLVES